MLNGQAKEYHDVLAVYFSEHEIFFFKVNFEMMTVSVTADGEKRREEEEVALMYLFSEKYHCRLRQRFMFLRLFLSLLRQIHLSFVSFLSPGL